MDRNVPWKEPINVFLVSAGSLGGSFLGYAVKISLTKTLSVPEFGTLTALTEPCVLFVTARQKICYISLILLCYLLYETSF